MGTAQTAVTQSLSLPASNTSTSYELDIRLLNKIVPPPSSFGSAVEKLIEEIATILHSIPPHPLEQYIMDGIDHRFSRYNAVNQQAIDSDRSILEIMSIDNSRFHHDQWYELAQRERLFEVILSLERQFHVQKLLQKFLRGTAPQSGANSRGGQQQSMKDGEQANQNSRYKINIQNRDPLGRHAQQQLKKEFIGAHQLTIRSNMKSFLRYESDISKNLLMRLFLHYYMLMLKTKVNTPGEKEVILKFHNKTGRNLALLMQSGELTLQQIYELAYLIIYIQKHPFQQAKHKYHQIYRKYHSIYLKNQHSIRVTSKQYLAVQTAARLYLDELYLCCIREAEDPYIHPTDDALNPIPMFPLIRVKEKYKG